MPERAGLACCGHTGSDHRAGAGCVAREGGSYCPCAVTDPRTIALADPDLQRERERLIAQAHRQEATADQRRRQRAAKEADRGPV